MGQPEMAGHEYEDLSGDLQPPELGAHESPAAVARRKKAGEGYAEIVTLNGIDERIRELNAKITEHESYRSKADDGSALAAEIDKDLARLTESLDTATERRRELLKTLPIKDDDLHDELEELL